MLIWGTEAGPRWGEAILVPLPAVGRGLGSRPGDDGGRRCGTSAEAPAARRGPGSGAGLLLGLGRGRRSPGLLGAGVGAGRPERAGPAGVALLAPGQAGSFRGHPQGRGAPFGARHPARHLSAGEPGDGQRLALFAPEGRRGARASTPGEENQVVSDAFVTVGLHPLGGHGVAADLVPDALVHPEHLGVVGLMAAVRTRVHGQRSRQGGGQLLAAGVSPSRPLTQVQRDQVGGRRPFPSPGMLRVVQIRQLLLRVGGLALRGELQIRSLRGT